jgi:DNA-binding transcriptional MerR regulator
MSESSYNEKLFYRISEVSEITGIKAHVLRYWEKEFKVIKPVKTMGGRRLYRKKDIETILKIKKLLYDMKYTIAGAKRAIKKYEEEGEQPVGDEGLGSMVEELKKIRELLED